MKFITFMQVGITKPVNLDPVMPVMALHSSKIVMKQLALGVNLILIETHHPNAPGNAIPADTLATIPPKKVTP